MHIRDDDNSGICRRLIRFVVTKLGIRVEKEMNEDKPAERSKLIKKGSRSDITIHFKQIEDSEDNNNISPSSSSQESERETMITLSNGNHGPKKRLHEKGKKNMLNEWSPKQQIAKPEAGNLPNLLIDINKKSDAFIESTLEKMRKGLA